jgi:hypothetical protein
VPLYLTEFGYQTDPPDPAGVSFAKQAAYLNEAEWITYRNPRVRTLTQFLLVDDEGTGGKDALTSFGGTFQSGLMTLQGKPKPAMLAYQLPIFVPSATVKRGSALRGLRPGAPGRQRHGAEGAGQLRQQTGSYKKLKTVTASKARATSHDVPGAPGRRRAAWLDQRRPDADLAAGLLPRQGGRVGRPRGASRELQRAARAVDERGWQGAGPDASQARRRAARTGR